MKNTDTLPPEEGVRLTRVAMVGDKPLEGAGLWRGS